MTEFKDMSEVFAHYRDDVPAEYQSVLDNIKSDIEAETMTNPSATKERNKVDIPPETLIWRNVSRLSSEVPETVHDGHKVQIKRALREDEADIADVGAMYRVICTQDGDVFDAFADELDNWHEVYNPSHH